MDVTQDAIKNLTAIQANQSSLVGGSYAQLMALRAQDAANAVVTSNISDIVPRNYERFFSKLMVTNLKPNGKFTASALPQMHPNKL